jgi:hypothetical protein
MKIVKNSIRLVTVRFSFDMLRDMHGALDGSSGNCSIAFLPTIMLNKLREQFGDEMKGIKIIGNESEEEVLKTLL